MFLAADQRPVGCGRRDCQWDCQPGQLLRHAEDKGTVRCGVARRERRCVQSDSALTGAWRSAPVDQGLDNDVGDEGSEDVTHAASQGHLSTLVPPLTASAVATPAQNGGCSTIRATRANRVSTVATF